MKDFIKNCQNNRLVEFIETISQKKKIQLLKIVEFSNTNLAKNSKFFYLK